MSSLVGPDEDNPQKPDGTAKPPVPEEVQDAIRTLLRWAGDDPTRGAAYNEQADRRSWLHMQLFLGESLAE